MDIATVNFHKADESPLNKREPSESSGEYMFMHKDTVVAVSRDDTFFDWDVHERALLPAGMDLLSVEQAEDAELPKSISSTEELVKERVRIQLNIRQKNDAQMTRWLGRRVLPLDRANAKIVYQCLGLQQLRTERDRALMAERFRGVSVTDNYWIKRASEQVCWFEVDVRKVPLSESLALIALVGEEAISLTSVVDIIDKQAGATVSTIGTFPKGCFRRDGELYIIKSGEYHSVIAEWLSARILSCTNVYGYCDYQLDDGTGGNEFPQTNTISVYCKVLSNSERDLVMATDIFDHAEEFAMERFPQQFAQMVVIDYLFGNSDRHGGNWGFYREAPDWEFTGLHDLYDHNKSFSRFSYSKRGESLPVSVVGRGTPKQTTLLEAAMAYKDLAQLKFTGPIQVDWFRKLGDDWQSYLDEFTRRCNVIGMIVQIV